MTPPSRATPGELDDRLAELESDPFEELSAEELYRIMWTSDGEGYPDAVGEAFVRKVRESRRSAGRAGSDST